jgi:hypothetical protein
MYKRCILLAVLLAFYSLAGHSQTKDELTKQYNDYFYSQKYIEALEIIEKLLETAPENLDYQREKIKMQSALGHEEAFFQSMIKLRNSSTPGNIKCFFNILSSDMIKKEFSNTLHAYFERKNDEYILTKWDVKLGEKTVSSSQHQELEEKEQGTPKEEKKTEDSKKVMESAIANDNKLASNSAKL